MTLLTSPLTTDLYELNMIQAYLDRGEDKEAVFEFFMRRLPPQRGFLLAAGLDDALDYLGTLVRSRTTAELLSFRGDLIDSAWRLLQQHPLIGGGIQSFRYFSPNSALYNWPHNIFLEIACELGIPAALLVCAVFGTAIRESLRQIRYRAAPHFAFSEITAALLAVGIINGTNTGDINSDRLTWLFVSLVFVARAIRTADRQRVSSPVYAQQPAETS